MAHQPAFDSLRILAIASQAIGFILIFVLGSTLESPRPWQGVILAIMISVALGVAIVRRYRSKRLQKERDERRARLLDDNE